MVSFLEPFNAQDQKWMQRVYWSSFPEANYLNLWQWAEKHFRAVGSPRGEQWAVHKTPWMRQPMEWLSDSRLRVLDMLMPVQSGKSAFGEIVVCYLIATAPAGDIQYNWQDDDNTENRYKKRVERVLKACQPVNALWPTDRRKVKKSLVIFPHLVFNMQGVFNTDNIESDTVWFQINEELHAWEPGRLKLAEKRQSAVDNYLRLNISTGSTKGDQFWQSWQRSTKRRWLEPCPHCGHYQVWHVKTEKGKLGGLRYDLNVPGTRNPDGTLNKRVLAESVYYECEKCGGHIKDDRQERYDRSQRGRYEEPADPRAEHQGAHMEQVSVYWIPWVDILAEKIEAQTAMQYGDIVPYRDYVKRIEAGFWDEQDRLRAPTIKLVQDHNLGEGLPDRAVRLATVDRQRGKAKLGELPFYKVVIRDWTHELDSRLYTACRASTDDDLLRLLEEAEVSPLHVAVDSGWDTQHVYALCSRYGFLAINGASRRNEWFHRLPDGSREARIYSEIREQDPFFGQGKPGVRKKILHLQYGKQAIRDALEAVRAARRWEVPEGASEEYLQEMESEYLATMTHPKTLEQVPMWVRVSQNQPNDYFVCECYQVLMVNMLQDLGFLQTHYKPDVRSRPEDIQLEDNGN